MLKSSLTLGIGPAGSGTKKMFELFAKVARNHNCVMADRHQIFDHQIRTKTVPGLQLAKISGYPTAELALQAAALWMSVVSSRKNVDHFILVGFLATEEEASQWKFLAPHLRVVELLNDDPPLPQLEVFNGQVLRVNHAQPMRQRLERIIDHVNVSADVRHRWHAHLKDHRHPVRMEIAGKRL